MEAKPITMTEHALDEIRALQKHFGSNNFAVLLDLEQTNDAINVIGYSVPEQEGTIMTVTLKGPIPGSKGLLVVRNNRPAFFSSTDVRNGHAPAHVIMGKDNIVSRVNNEPTPIRITHDPTHR